MIYLGLFIGVIIGAYLGAYLVSNFDVINNAYEIDHIKAKNSGIVDINQNNKDDGSIKRTPTRTNNRLFGIFKGRGKSNPKRKR